MLPRDVRAAQLAARTVSIHPLRRRKMHGGREMNISDLSEASAHLSPLHLL